MNTSSKDQAAARRAAVRGWRGRPGVGACAAAVLVVAPGAAQGIPRAQAQASETQRKGNAEILFEQGKELLAQGQVALACERFEQSHAMDPGIGTLGRLGECYAQLGKLFSAWAVYKEVASKARQVGQLERASVAEARARELQPQLPRITLREPPDAPRGLELIFDGDAVASALLGVPFSVDPGTHRLIARAPGYQTWSATIEAERNGGHREIVVPALSRLHAAPAAAASEPPPLLPAASPSSPALPQWPPREPPRDAPEAASPRRSLAYVLGGAGLGVLGAGVVLGMVADDRNEEALSKYCTPEGCYDPEGTKLNRSARRWATAANVSYVTGAAALGTATVLFFLDLGGMPAQSGSLEWAPYVGDTTGLAVRGQF